MAELDNGDTSGAISAAATIPTPKWYVHLGENDIRGPSDSSTLKSLLEGAIIDGLTNVWCEGMEAWKPLAECEELRAVLGVDETCVGDFKPSGGVGDSDNLLEPENQPENRPLDERKHLLEPENQQKLTNPINSNDDATQRLQAKREKKKRYLQRRKQRIETGQWIDSRKNLSVYVHGLPPDTTLEEVASIFKKAGVIKIDPVTTLPKIKLYRDESGRLKSDARVTFVNKESVEFATKYLDNYYMRPDCVIHVEEAKYDPTKFKGKSMSASERSVMRKKYLAAKYEQERLQSWAEEVDDGSGRRIVICKPMFSRQQAEMHEAGSPFYSELRDEVAAEISKFVPVEKVTPIARHPQGVVCVKFRSSADAEIFIAKFNDRLFDGNRLSVYFFDGKSDLQAQTLPSRLPMVDPESDVDPVGVKRGEDRKSVV